MTNVKTTEKKNIMTGAKFAFDKKKELVTITVPVKGYSLEELATADWSELPLVGDGYKKVGTEKVHMPEECNFRIATSHGTIHIEQPGYEHIMIGLNVFAKKAPVKARKQALDQLALQAQIREEQAAKISKPAPATSTPVAQDIELLKAIVKANPSAFATLTAEQQARLLSAL